jgi:hypothetical protein
MNFVAKILMNSLYGRFGMADKHDKITIIDNESFDDFIEKRNQDTIINIINMDSHFLMAAITIY